MNLIKDDLVLLAIHPERGWVRRQNDLRYVLVAATLCDLTLMDAFELVEGKISASPVSCGDELLDTLANSLINSNGRKFWHTSSRRRLEATKYLKRQMRSLEHRGMIHSRTITWLGIPLAKRYSLQHSCSIKTLINTLERVLIYGRTPDLRTSVLIRLLKMLRVTGYVFRGHEYRAIARKRARVVSKMPFDAYEHTLETIFKELRTTLQMSDSRRNLG